MKVIALILSVFVSFLVIEPGVDAMIHLGDGQHTHKSCCKHCCNKNADKQSHKQKKNCCENGDCNPFAMCQCCSGFVVATIFYNVSQAASYKELSVTSGENIQSSFFQNFWQPPKIS